MTRPEERDVGPDGRWLEPLTNERRGLLLVLTGVAMSVALLGSAVEIFHGTGRDVASAKHRPVPSAGEPGPRGKEALSYGQLPTELKGPNSGWENHFQTLRVESPIPANSVARLIQVEESGLHRRARRAYDGAPPVIPHVADERSSASCLVCHDEGLTLDGRVASPIPHPHYQSCTQCHAQDENSILLPGLEVQNQFVRNKTLLGASGVLHMGDVPPAIPHTTWMRQKCASCHGVLGREPLRASHPDGKKCVQCHARSADREQLGTASGQQ